jgi:hypothetical protein
MCPPRRKVFVYAYWAKLKYYDYFEIIITHIKTFRKPQKKDALASVFFGKNFMRAKAFFRFQASGVRDHA